MLRCPLAIEVHAMQTAIQMEPPLIASVAHQHEILLVDDHIAVRRALGEALTLLGCRVETVGSGEEALDALRTGLSPCLIFLDPWMPHGSARLFRDLQLADRELVDVPVAVLSAMDASPEMEIALQT